MKGLIGVCAMSAAFAFAVCLISCTICFAGFGTPNCEATTYGYVEFYATLFGCSFASCFGLWLMIATTFVIDKFVNKSSR